MRERLPHVRRDHSFGDTREKTLNPKRRRGLHHSIIEIETKPPSLLFSDPFYACPPGSSRILPRNRKSLQRGGGWDALLGANIKGLGENSGPFLFVNNLTKQNLQHNHFLVNFILINNR